MKNGCEMPSPRGHLTVSLESQEKRDGSEVLLGSEPSETPDTVVQCTLDSPRVSLACPEELHGRKHITFCPASPGSHGAQWQPRYGCVEIITPAPHVPGFVVRPWCWIMERTLGWLGRQRRLSKDYEHQVQTSETLLQLAMIRPMVGRLARSPA